MKKTRIWLILILLIGLCLENNLAFAQTESLNALVYELSQHAAVKRGKVVLSVYEVNSKKQVYQFNEHQFVKPASILKLITTGVALEQLGAMHQIKTILGYSGSIQDGVLKGNLIVKGFGDPTFGSDRFGEEYTLTHIIQQFSMALMNAGITSIDGNILVDASSFDTAVNSPKWLWEDIGNYYGAGAAGFNVLENKYAIEFHTTTTGEKTQILNTYPTIKGVELINEVRVGETGSGDQAYVFGAPFTTRQYIRGTLPPNQKSFTIKAAIPNPALFFAQTLKEQLKTNGIICYGETKAYYAAASCERIGDQLYTHKSPLLKDIAHLTNVKSINLYAECLLKMLAAGCNTTGNVNSGILNLENYFDTKGFSKDDYQIYDGSGLSPINKLTANFFTRNLIELHRSANSEAWMKSLSAIANNVQAKSGYMDGVRSYAGFVKDAQNRLLAFTFAVNDYTCSASEMKKLMKPIILKLSELN